MNMLALIAVALIAAFGGGYGTAWKVAYRHIAQLEAQINESNLSAALVLSDATARTAKAESEAANTALLLESEHAKATQSTDNTRRALSAMRLRDPGQRQRCADPVSKSASAQEPEADSDPGQLSKELSGFLRGEAYRADTVANYADECHRFVAANCGIAPSSPQ